MGSGLAMPHCKGPGPLMQSRAVNAHRPVKRACKHHDIDPFAYQIDMAEFKKED